MPALALGMASTIRIGYRVGAGELLEARTTVAIALVSTIGVAILGSLTIFFLREDIVNVYTTETNVSQLSATLLLFVVFFLVFDACQSTCLGVLRGYKDTRTPLFIALLCFWLIGLPIGVHSRLWSGFRSHGSLRLLDRAGMRSDFCRCRAKLSRMVNKHEHGSHTTSVAKVNPRGRF